MNDLKLKTENLKDRHDLLERADNLCGKAWPEFMLHDTYVGKYWDGLFEKYLEFQFVLLETISEQILAVGNCVPLPWVKSPEELPEAGIDWILTEAFDGKPGGNQQKKALFALQVVINPDFLGHSLSSKAICSMLEIGRLHGCHSLFAPVRPNHKHRYPLTPMDEYITWKNQEGLPFDPWMRVHARLGAELIGVCDKSMYIPGDIVDWEKWTGMKFPSSGDYIIPGALVPVQMDIENDLGLYIEPNVWMRHTIDNL